MKRIWTQKPPLGVLPNFGNRLSQSLVGLWLFNEGTGLIVNDLSGSGLTGTLSADLSWVAGKYGHAIDFPGVTDYITAATPPGLVDGGAITYIVRFKSDIGSAGGDQVLIRVKDSVLKIDSGALANLVWYPDVDEAAIDCDFVFAANRWYEVAVTQVGTAYVLYVNGVQIQSGACDAIDMTSAVNVIIGAYNTTGTWDLDGQIDHVKVYNRAFSPFEMAKSHSRPFCMFERDPIELWSAAALGAPPVGIPILRRRRESA